MNSIDEIVRLQKENQLLRKQLESSGMRWIDGRNELPNDDRYVVIRYGGAIYQGHKNYDDENPKFYIETDTGSFLTRECEWLDETQPQLESIKGGKWVKASERLSDHMVKVCCRMIKSGNWLTGYYDWSRKVYMCTNMGPQGVKPEDVEWLDETPSLIEGDKAMEQE